MRKSTKKLLVTTGISMILAMGMAITSYAGEWNQTGYGWWYNNGNGSYTANDWQYIDNTWYYFNQDGYIRTGWIYVNEKWYYCHENGTMAHDTWIDGKYYVGSDGAMYTNTTTPDGYKVDENGKYIEKVTESKKSNKKKTITFSAENWDRYLQVTKFNVSLSNNPEMFKGEDGYFHPAVHVRISVRATEEGRKYIFKDSAVAFKIMKKDWLDNWVWFELNENGSGTYDTEDLVSNIGFTNGTGLKQVMDKTFAEHEAKYEADLEADNIFTGKLIPRE